MNVVEVEPVAAVPRDRRDSRWDEHRRRRREELVDATLAAVARHGADVGMDEIAAAAGTSKTVVYRHFADRAELYLAVSRRVADDLVPRLRRAVADTAGPREMMAAAVDTYLAFVEADPELYRFVVHGVPSGRIGRSGPTSETDPIGSLSDAVGHQVAALIGTALRRAGRGTDAAEPWGHALVGLVRSTADWWLRTGRPLPRATLTAQLTDLAWSGLGGVIPTLEEHP
ncbi:TetR family transcriptional regulator [Nakamurella deserti]|uniref:TetR family transcriptional regulator n=1 Tax=Nakamurella deserti TaxID=2164074 RepID=UPI000DBE44AB|nr:TetR family transcriptional regulator [Nakamurella deserti]